jgi:hypothetical protein
VIFAYAALAHVFSEPLDPAGAMSDPAFDLDASYQVAMSDAVARGLRVGEDVVFTYGPLGHLAFAVRPPSVLAVNVGASLVFLAAFTGLAISVARRSGVPWWVALPVLCVLVSLTRGFESRAYGLAILYVAYLDLAGDDASLPLLALAAFVLGAAALVKFTFFPLAIGVAAVLAVRDLIRGERRGLLLLGIVAAAAPLVWLVLYGSPAGYASFLAGSAEIARGYGEAMQLDGPLAEVVLFVVAAAFLLAVHLVGSRRDGLLARALAAAALAMILFVVFKHGFVRHDAHARLGWSALVFVALASLPSRLRDPRRALRVAAAAGLVLAACLQAYAYHGWEGYYAAVARADVAGAPANARRAAGILFGDGLSRLRREWSDLLDRVAAANAIPTRPGSADLYPWDLRLLFAHRLDWRPRPVLQSYSAYTERLLRLNADHLRGQGPDSVLVAVRTIDGRYPSLDDGLSWPVLLEWYRPTAAGGGYLLLARSAAPRAVHHVPLVGRPLRFGQRMPVDAPPGTLVWARIAVEPAVRARLLEVIYKLPFPTLEVTLADGSERRFRLVREMAGAGFLLSPLVSSADELLPILADDRERVAALPRVESFAVGLPSASAEALLGGHVEVTLESLQPARASATAATGE